MRILIVEDEVRLGEDISRALREGPQHSVDWAVDGEMALSLAQQHLYDVVVLDLRLPRLSGIDVLSGLRNARNRVPVLILTANYDRTSVVRAFEAGADDYLFKPFDLHELFGRIEALGS